MVCQNSTRHNLTLDNTAKPAVLVCGLIAADLIFQIDSLPSSAEKFVAQDAEWGIGGGGANAALALQRLGGQANLVGRVGDDVIGQFVIDKLLSEQVDCQWVQRITGSRSAVSSIYIDARGERQIVNFRGAMPTSEPTANSVFDSSMLEFCKAVLVDTRWEAAALAIITAARSRQLPIVVDAEAPTSDTVMALATHIAFSRQGLRDYADSEDIESALRLAQMQFNNWVCVTDGEEGVYHLQAGQLQHTPSYQVAVVDTLGAGDVWHAAFTLQLGRGRNEIDAISYANAAAALKCTRSGGVNGAPNWQDVEELIARGHG